MSETEFSLETEYLDDEKRWMAATSLDKETLCAAVEAVVFMSDKPLPVRKIQHCLGGDVPEKTVEEALTCLQESYAEKKHGVELVHVAKGWRFCTKSDYAKYIQDLFRISATLLSPTAMEVLAIIAYRQPISKSQIDDIRGVDSSYVVRGLMDKRLVKTIGRAGELGRSTLYGTTAEFLELFNLADLDQLPAEHELHQMASEGVGQVSDIRQLVQAGGESSFFFDEIEELDRLGQQIKEVSTGTDFTKALEVTKKDPQRSAFDVLAEYAAKKEEPESAPEEEPGVSPATINFRSGEVPAGELEVGDEIEIREEDIDRISAQMIKSAKELDLDLDFLKEDDSDD